MDKNQDIRVWSASVSASASEPDGDNRQQAKSSTTHFGHDAPGESFIERIPGALRRTPSPQQSFDGLTRQVTAGQDTFDESSIPRLPGALRRTPIPQQLFDGASRQDESDENVIPRMELPDVLQLPSIQHNTDGALNRLPSLQQLVDGVPATGVVTAGTLSSIREERGDFKNHSRSSEEANLQPRSQMHNEPKQFQFMHEETESEEDDEDENFSSDQKPLNAAAKPTESLPDDWSPKSPAYSSPSQVAEEWPYPKTDAFGETDNRTSSNAAIMRFVSAAERLEAASHADASRRSISNEEDFSAINPIWSNPDDEVAEEGPSSNAAMMRFARAAEELETASYAATDGSHRSVLNKEESFTTPNSPMEPPDVDDKRFRILAVVDPSAADSRFLTADNELLNHIGMRDYNPTIRYIWGEEERIAARNRLKESYNINIDDGNSPIVHPSASDSRLLTADNELSNDIEMLNYDPALDFDRQLAYSNNFYPYNILPEREGQNETDVPDVNVNTALRINPQGNEYYNTVQQVDGSLHRLDSENFSSNAVEQHQPEITAAEMSRAYQPSKFGIRDTDYNDTNEDTKRHKQENQVSVPRPPPLAYKPLISVAADSDDNDDDDDDYDVSTPPESYSKLPIEPTFEGFKKQIHNLGPRLKPALVDRFARQQLSRYKRLIEEQYKHQKAVQAGNCPADERCFASGGHAKLLPTKTNAPIFIITYDKAKAYDQLGNSEPIDSRVVPAVFAEGIPMPPVKKLPAEFECPLCFKVKRFQKPSEWMKHIYEDLCPFTCTFPECKEPNKSFKRKVDWVRHETEYHRHLEWWQCNMPECDHKCFRKDNFIMHLVREHGKPDPTAKTTKAPDGTSGINEEMAKLWTQVEECHHVTLARPDDEPCRFCSRIFKDWKKLSAHLARHMEKIALPVLDLVEKHVLADNGHSSSYQTTAAPTPLIPLYTDLKIDDALKSLDIPDLEMTPATTGFENDTLRLEHESSHAIRLQCPFPGCQYPPFPSARALKSHETRCHAAARLGEAINKESPGEGIQSSNNQLPSAAETYTDSGYASNTTRAPKALEMLEQFQQAEELSDESLQDIGEEYEVSSIYSDASSIPTPRKAGYIDRLADDLVQAIQPYQLNDEILQQVLEILPELLKSFALTLGHHSSGKMDRDVMVFIHRYRRQIVQSFKDHLLMEEPEGQGTDQEDKMSLNEIMNLWHISEERAQDEQPNNPEFNDDLDPEDTESTEAEEEKEDDEYEADDNELPGLVAYRSLIRGAPAYNWFLDNLRRECTLAPPEPNLIGEIRNVILKGLPSSPKISRRKPAEIFNMSFLVDWDPVAFLREEEYTERPEDGIEWAITLTGSINASAQALTCGEYLRQTWPSTSEQILDLIKRLVSGENRASAALMNGSSLTVSYHPSQTQGSSSVVWVDARGTAACIAEIGEQFAWLASALRSSPYPQQVAYSRPFIDRIQIGHVTNEETTYICKIGVGLHQGESGPGTTNGECWHGLFGRPTVVQGFPIPRRSAEESSPGLEIPLNIMACLAEARRIASFAGKTILKGFAAMLLPMKCTQGMVTWHLVHSKNGERTSHLEVGNFQTADVQIQELEKSRHILGWCPEMKSYAGAADASYLIKGSRLPRPSGRGVLSNASLSLGHLVTGGTPFSVGRKDVRLRRNSYIARMKWISQKFVILWDVEDQRGWLVNGTSALLHLVRASLAQDLLDSKFGALCVFTTKEFQEASQLHQPDAALEVLLNPSNLKAKVYPEEDDFIHFKAYVEDFSDLLERMLDYQLGVAGNNVPRSLLEGWDFNDLATGRDPIYPREAFLNQEALSWIDFTRSVHAITLFGRSFGELIQPAGGQCCSAWANMPCGRSYLAASATDLHNIMESDGDPYSVPMRLTHDVLWYTSKETFRQCQCTADDETHSDIAQVLLPFSLHRELSGISSQLPAKNGAVIFGYNNNHKWFWSDKGDPSRTPNEGGSMLLPIHKGILDSRSSASDSGIGRSLGSSASITGSMSNKLDEEYFEYTRTVTTEPEDFPSSSINKNSNISIPLANHYKVGIVCALHIELMAVRASFDKAYEKVAIANEDPYHYSLGSIEGHNVVAVCLPHGEYGTNTAADVASNMRRSFPGLKFCLLVGIGGGVPSQKNDIRLGDVVISTPKGNHSGVLPYDMIKSFDSGAFELNGYLCPPPRHLMSAISDLESDPSRSSTPLHKYLQQIEECQGQYKHPGVSHDQLFASGYVHHDASSLTCDECNSAYEIKRPVRSSTHPELHYGLIASGNQVMKSAEIRDKLSREHNVLCFEMEGAGIMNNFPCLIIRGICDYADSHKNKRWQNYAAATAAAYAKLLLSRLRTVDGVDLEPIQLLSRKRSATTELSQVQPWTKRREG